MKAILLAAGEGKRLKPFTNDNPKCLIPLEKKSIFDRQVDIIKNAGITDIIVVRGHKSEKINRSDVRYYENKDYAITNMVMTLWCAEHELEDEVIVSYADIIYNQEVLQKLMDSSYDISVVVDTDWKKYWRKRFENPLADAEAFKYEADGKILIIGQKAQTLSDVEAGYIGLMKFKGKGIQALKESFHNAKKIAQQGGKPWGIDKKFENAYMTDMLQGMINEGTDVFAVNIEGGWLEIDDPDDYEIAKSLFKDGQVLSVV